VIDSRASREGVTIRRRRECASCGHRYTTRGLGRIRENLPNRRRCKKRTAGLRTKLDMMLNF
jgi:hypothetical protein